MNWKKRLTLETLATICMFALLCCLAGGGSARADVTARTVKYSEADIVAIRAKMRFTTLIVLPANEEILEATTGDKEFWIINGAHNLCHLHPAGQNIRSNLNLITSSGHVYSFLLTEISNDRSAEPDLKIFIERKEESTLNGGASAPLARASEVQAYKTAVDTARAEATQAAQAADEHAQKAISDFREEYPVKLTFDYTFDAKAAGPPFAVAAIYHDDKFTYVKSSAQEKPTVYELKDGKPNLINFELRNGVYVVPKILDSGYLVLGNKRLNFNRHAQ
jgi:type IV secretion system protein VirB9